MTLESKDELKAHYASTRILLMEAIEGLNEEQMRDASMDGWSVCDHLVHITVWDELRRTEIERIGDGGLPSWRLEDGNRVEDYNQLTVALRRHLPVAQVLHDLEASRRRLLDTISSAPDLALDASRYGGSGLRSSHEAEHAGWIREWRQSRGI